MKYHQIQPPPHLQDYVRYYWALESSGRPDEQVHFVTIADGSPGIVFQQLEGASFQEGKRLSPVYMYGQSTAHTRIVSPFQRADQRLSRSGSFSERKATHGAAGKHL
jgi:hypothetical protein